MVQVTTVTFDEQLLSRARKTAAPDRVAALQAAFEVHTPGRTDMVAVSRRLEMGDVLLEAAESPVVVAVERKHVTDLMASHFDGRLSEQSQRMRDWQLAAAATRWAVVIVEGTASPRVFHAARDPKGRFHHFCKVSLQLSLCAHSPADQRLVLRTGDVHETAALLLTLHKTLSVGAEGAQTAVARASLPRKSQGNVFVRHLCCTQGVSEERARRVQSHFPNMAALVQAMQAAPSETETNLASSVGGIVVARRLWSDLGGEPLAVPHKRRGKPSTSSSSSSATASGPGEVTAGITTLATSSAPQSQANAFLG
jgi:ERCC4-type nuclease